MEYHTTFLSLPEGRRIIAVSDIHGHLSLLKALLEKIRYKPGDDLLFLVGDTVEKGPDSLGTLPVSYTHLDVYKRQSRWPPCGSAR